MQSKLRSSTNVQDWFGSMGFLTFLREVGKHARVNVMLSRESVRQRLERDEGISYTECASLLNKFESIPLASQQEGLEFPKQVLKARFVGYVSGILSEDTISQNFKWRFAV